MTGLPREFTFVFLVARPLKAKSILKGKMHEHKQEKDIEAMDAPNKISMHKCLDHIYADAHWDPRQTSYQQCN